MKNLAGVPDCDDYIRMELKKARIPAIDGERVNHEVAYSVTGRLAFPYHPFGAFSFRRAWYYWVAIGDMPVALAKELYADPIGKTDIRVSGNCGCPPPEEPFLTWKDADGYELVKESERPEFERCFKDKMLELMEKQKLRFSNDRSRDGKAYVDVYHIDTQEGLRLFADIIHRGPER